MNELKPEDVMRALAWYEVVCKNIGSVTVPSNELQAIAALLREKDAEIERLNKAIAEMEDRCSTCDNAVVDRISTARAEAITEFCKKKGIDYVEDDLR